MKKSIVILASLVLFSGVSFASPVAKSKPQQTATDKAKDKKDKKADKKVKKEKKAGKKADAKTPAAK